MADATQLSKLGFKFAVDEPTGTVFVGRGEGLGKTAGFERLRGETVESLQSAGLGDLITSGDFAEQTALGSFFGGTKALGSPGEMLALLLTSKL